MAKRFLLDQSAPTMVEYGLLVGLIALAAVLGVSLFGGGVAALFEAPSPYLP